jgi:lipoate-protein ligase B
MRGEKTWHLYSMGLMEYQDALFFQQKITALRHDQKIPDALILLEHPHTYTLGPKSNKNHFLVPSEWIEKGEVAVHHVDRGGEITYHGPGQLVGYPIIQLDRDAKEVGSYVRNLEKMLITALQLSGFHGSKMKAHAKKKYRTGVWVNDAKIASIGIKVDRHRITSHGFALNVNTELDYFQKIVPCGMEGCEVVSIAHLEGQSVSLREVADHVIHAFSKVFNAKFITKEEIKTA